MESVLLYLSPINKPDIYLQYKPTIASTAKIINPLQIKKHLQYPFSWQPKLSLEPKLIIIKNNIKDYRHNIKNGFCLLIPFKDWDFIGLFGLLSFTIALYAIKYYGF